MNRNGHWKSELVTVLVVVSIMALLLIPAIKKTRGDHRYTRTRKNLKSIGLAMHNYEFDHGRFPDAVIWDGQGSPLLSWRVLLLPYLDQQELYDQFDLSQPWDSEHNKKLISRIPDVYQNEFIAKQTNKTNLLFPVSASLSTEQSTMFPSGRGVKIEEIIDGTSQTIMVVMVKEELSVIWTKPEDWSYNPKDSLEVIQTGDGPGFYALMADGAVQYFSLEENAEQDIASRLTYAGGEEISETGW